MQKIDLEGKTVLITGAAGFIGSFLTMRILRTERNVRVVGLDNLSAYYDVSIKEYRLKEIEKTAAGNDNGSSFVFIRGSIAERETVREIFRKYDPAVVVNLAAQAGVRYSIDHPDEYIESNIVGFYEILEACRHSAENGRKGVEHLVYASSSSVYGNDSPIPYRVEDPVEHPVSLYAATKKSDELLAHAYSKLYEIPSTGLRFFTVYGPAGRPDMAYFGFTDKLRRGEKIRIFNYGKCKRDFTYVDDVTDGVLRVMKGAPERKTGENGLPVPPYAVYNIGNSEPVELPEFVRILSEELIRNGVLPEDFDLEANEELVPMQPGDVETTFADTSALKRDYGFAPGTRLKEGIARFAQWYREFYLG